MDDWSQFPLRQDLLTQSVDKSSSWLDKEQMLDNCSYLVSSYLGQDHYGGILLRQRLRQKFTPVFSKIF